MWFSKHRMLGILILPKIKWRKLNYFNNFAKGIECGKIQVFLGEGRLLK